MSATLDQRLERSRRTDTAMRLNRAGEYGVVCGPGVSRRRRPRSPGASVLGDEHAHRADAYDARPLQP
jgi:hypothetical protein